jgi:hypothetical protein
MPMTSSARAKHASAVLLAALAFATSASGAPAAGPRGDGPRAGARATPSSSANLPPGHPDAKLPPGHPDTNLPPGHPDVTADETDDGSDDLPPGHPRPSAPSPTPKEAALPEDTSDVDKALPAGSIVVEIRDRFDKPMPHVDVTMGILRNTVAKGESRSRTIRQTDDSGNIHFDGLDAGAGVAYRITVPWGDNGGGEVATYAAFPFQLDLHNGQRVRVHVYPVTGRIEEAMVGMDATVVVELKDDALQMTERFQVYNFGAVTWVPKDITINLPPGFKAFNAQKEMSDTGFDEAPQKGAKMRGTFTPGQHDTVFRYQIPYGGEESVDFSLSLPPHVARMRVIAEANKDMALRVTDFPASQRDRSQTGQSVLVTQRELKAGDQPMKRARIMLDNIPTEGSTKWVAVGISAITIATGLYVAFEQEKEKRAQLKTAKGKKTREDQDTERARNRLVAEIASLDRAHASGEVGPKAYARIREALIDALARLMMSAA